MLALMCRGVPFFTEPDPVTPSALRAAATARTHFRKPSPFFETTLAVFLCESTNALRNRLISERLSAPSEKIVSERLSAPSEQSTGDATVGVDEQERHGD